MFSRCTLLFIPFSTNAVLLPVEQDRDSKRSGSLFGRERSSITGSLLGRERSSIFSLLHPESLAEVFFLASNSGPLSRSPRVLTSSTQNDLHNAVVKAAVSHILESAQSRLDDKSNHLKVCHTLEGTREKYKYY